MFIKILGSAAGGGFPQWNCSCRNCSGIRAGTLRVRPRTQTQVAFSPDGAAWFLLNASPDLRSQLIADLAFAPVGKARGTPLTTVFLTSADVDSVLGLLHLREFQPFRILCTPSVRRILTEENSLFRTLARSAPPVRWEALPLDRLIPFSHPSTSGAAAKTNFFAKAASLGGQFPDYVSDGLRRQLLDEEAVIGLQFIHNEKRFFFAPSLPGTGGEWKKRVAESDLSLLDGTFWTGDELAKSLGTGKSALEMGHLPLSGTTGLLEQLRLVPKRRVLIHINNTNPVLDEESSAHRFVRDAGFEIGYDGMEFQL